MTSPDTPPSYKVGDDVETIVPPTGVDIHPLNAQEEQAAREDPNAFRIHRAAWESMKKLASAYTTLTIEQFQKSSGLPETMAQSVFLGMQARGHISRQTNKYGSYTVLHPDGEAAYRPVQAVKPHSRLVRALFEVAGQGAEVLHARGVRRRTYDNNRAGEVGAMPGENNRQLWGVVVTDSPLDKPNYFNPELNPQDELRRRLQPRRQGREGGAVRPRSGDTDRSSRPAPDGTSTPGTDSRKRSSPSARGPASTPRSNTTTAGESLENNPTYQPFFEEAWLKETDRKIGEEIAEYLRNQPDRSNLSDEAKAELDDRQKREKQRIRRETLHQELAEALGDNVPDDLENAILGVLVARLKRRSPRPRRTQ